MGSGISAGLRAFLEKTRQEDLVTFVSVLPETNRTKLAKALAEVDGASLIDLPGTISDAAALLERNTKLLKAAAISDLNGVVNALAQGADVNATYDQETMKDLGDDADIRASQLHQTMLSDPNYVFSVSEWSALPLQATALILACRTGCLAVVQRLLAEAGIDCNRGSMELTNIMRNNQTAICWACRQGNLDVVRALLADERCDVNKCQDNGFSPLSLAMQQGHVQVVDEMLNSPRVTLRTKPAPHLVAMFDELMFKPMGKEVGPFLECDCNAGLHLMMAAGAENRLQVVERAIKDKRIQKFFFDKDVQDILPLPMQGLRPTVLFEHSPAMLELWLKHGLDPNACMPDGSTMLDMTLNRNVEQTRVLLMHNAAATQLSPLRRAQVMGDALQVKKLVHEQPSVDATIEGDAMPPLHRAAVRGDDEEAVVQVRKELEKLTSDSEAARNLLDEGKLPAAFYAVEVGHLKVARELFERAHGFPSSLVDKLLEACGQEKDAIQGERSFRVCYGLIENGAIEDDTLRAGALAFLKPWCSSLAAVRFLDQGESFPEFSKLCQTKNNGFYKGVDEKVGKHNLTLAGRVAMDAPNPTEGIRQDDGVVPQMKFYRMLALKAPFSADHEAAVAHTYALLGQALGSVYQAEIKRVFEGSARVVTVEPKSFQRMQNKLLNPAEHGDPSLKRPRCAKNVDVLRGCLICKDVQELEEAYDRLQANFKVVRVKNTHDPSNEGFRGGYRSLLVNFIFESNVTWGQLFGDQITFDFSDMTKASMKKPTKFETNQNHLGNLWVDYVERENTIPKLIGLQALQVTASAQPNEPVRMIAELQLVLEPYFAGRTVSHMLFKIARCDTGAMEMVRDFFQEYYNVESRNNPHLQAVRDIGTAVYQGREPPARVIEQGSDPASALEIDAAAVASTMQG